MDGNVFIPCRDYCYIRHGKSYTKECDANCSYAKVVKDSKQKDEVIDYLLDMIEDEHMGMMAVARDIIEEKFGMDF